MFERIQVRTVTSLRPGWITVEPLPFDPTPGFVRLGPDVPREVPTDMLPADLRKIGSTFWLIYDSRSEPLRVERLADVL